MVEQEEPGRDLAGLVVPLAGRLAATGDRWEPYRLVDAGGKAVGAAGAYFGHLQAAGRAELTVRSYGMDLLRWFRFLWASGVAWDRATGSEARDFCRWLQLAGKPVRPHWRERSRPGTGAAVPVAGEVYAPSVRAHSETVLRSFYDLRPGGGHGPVCQPVPAGPVPAGRAGPCAPQSDGALSPRAQRHVPSGGAVADPSQRPR
jgi:hypothetical protein